MFLNYPKCKKLIPIYFVVDGLIRGCLGRLEIINLCFTQKSRFDGRRFKRFDISISLMSISKPE